MYGVSQIDISEDVTVVTLNNMPLSVGVAASVFARMGEAGVLIDMVSQTSPIGDRVNISFTCPDKDLRNVLDITKQAKEQHPNVTSLASSGNAKIQLYGDEMRKQSGVFARALSALSDAGVEPQLITTSEVDISLLVTAHCLPGAKAALEAAFEL